MEQNNALFSTPILFVIFNRPDTTKLVFEAIRKIKPTKLYIVADGAREKKKGELNLCEDTRLVTENIDWECEVFRKYSDKNLGCKVNMSNGISWFFENEEQGIILEDDCLPDQSFFSYCQELLNKYKNVDKVKMISGNNFQFGRKYGEASYFFSNFPNIWGWATWRRAWRDYDIEMKSYPEFKKNKKIINIFRDKRIQKFMIKLFDRLYSNKMNTWAGRWAYAIYNSGGVSIAPNVNLVSNIGFGKNSTNTKKEDNISNNIPTEALGEIIHPNRIVVSEEADDFLFQKIFYKNIFEKIINRIKMYLKI